MSGLYRATIKGTNNSQTSFRDAEITFAATDLGDAERQGGAYAYRLSAHAMLDSVYLLARPEPDPRETNPFIREIEKQETPEERAEGVGGEGLAP